MLGSVSEAGEFRDALGFQAVHDLCITPALARDEPVTQELAALRPAPEFLEHGPRFLDQPAGIGCRDAEPLCEILRYTAGKFGYRVDMVCKDSLRKCRRH